MMRYVWGLFSAAAAVGYVLTKDPVAAVYSVIAALWAIHAAITKDRKP